MKWCLNHFGTQSHYTCKLLYLNLHIKRELNQLALPFYYIIHSFFPWESSWKFVDLSLNYHLYELRFWYTECSCVLVGWGFQDYDCNQGHWLQNINRGVRDTNCFQRMHFNHSYFFRFTLYFNFNLLSRLGR